MACGAIILVGGTYVAAPRPDVGSDVALLAACTKDSIAAVTAEDLSPDAVTSDG